MNIEKIKTILKGTMKDFLIFTIISSIGLSVTFTTIFLAYEVLKNLPIEVTMVSIVLVAIFLISLLRNIFKNF